MMDWQTPTVGILVFTAIVYLVRSSLRNWFGSKSGCGSGCGKCGEEKDAHGRIALPRAD
jgi:hypothetical protein